MEQKYFVSPTFGNLNLVEVSDKIVDIVKCYPTDAFKITIGTDSQNFDKTKIVLVIVLEHIGKGGNFFYNISRINRIDNVRQKLFTETQMSLECAEALLKIFEEKYEKTGFDYTKMQFVIHVDAGENGKTKSVIPEIVSWVKSCGYDCVTKPDSYAASSVADKYSK